MYYVEAFHGSYVVKKEFDDYFILGPFTDSGDASFIAEMLNNGKLSFNEGELYGKEDSKEPYTVY